MSLSSSLVVYEMALFSGGRTMKRNEGHKNIHTIAYLISGICGRKINFLE